MFGCEVAAAWSCCDCHHGRHHGTGPSSALPAGVAPHTSRHPQPSKAHNIIGYNKSDKQVGLLQVKLVLSEGFFPPHRQPQF